MQHISDKKLCRHPHVYNHSTNQRSVNLLDFSDHVKPKHYDIDGDQLRVTCKYDVIVISLCMQL